MLLPAHTVCLDRHIRLEIESIPRPEPAMRRRTTLSQPDPLDPAGHVATLGRLAEVQLAIAGRVKPVESAMPVPLRSGVGRVLARPLFAPTTAACCWTPARRWPRATCR